MAKATALCTPGKPTNAPEAKGSVVISALMINNLVYYLLPVVIYRIKKLGNNYDEYDILTLTPTGSTKKTTKSAKENLDCTPAEKARVMVHWAKADNHHITDTLLTLIEDSVTWKGIFGFDKGVKKDSTPTGKGKSIIQHCADIAKVLFSIGKKNSEWNNDNLAHLRGMVKNRGHVLGETGHGLIIGGHEDELHAGSDIANVYAEVPMVSLHACINGYKSHCQLKGHLK
ncbi:hypothetical protein BS17DRAFT_765109, partial [Gyrodon lividus]